MKKKNAKQIERRIRRLADLMIQGITNTTMLALAGKRDTERLMKELDEYNDAVIAKLTDRVAELEKRVASAELDARDPEPQAGEIEPDSAVMATDK